MKPVIYHPSAETEYLRALRHYHAEKPGLGDEFADEVEQVIGRIVERPESGAPEWGGSRRMLLFRFPYIIIYLDQPDRIFVLAVMHQRRRPGYWHRRVRPQLPRPRRR